MAGDPIDLDVDSLEWDERNLTHVADHGVTRDEVEAVLANAPQFFADLPERSGTHVMIGPDANNRFLFVVLAETATRNVWRVITADRYARRRALRHYRRST
ncbi:MAG TPA: BrnT family toxin [Dehalococcoidia bacterium]|nr:BrnT family toxin [Dehalococcoidia bacterium]